MKNEYILCCAIKRVVPTNCSKLYYENDIYDIELGYRHADILHRFKGIVSKNPYDQGFYTSKGRFVSRNEAFRIALQAHQIPVELVTERGIDGDLYSEDLY